MTPPYLIRPATPDDAEAMARCHVACLIETYRTIMPPEFAENYRREIDEHIAEQHEALKVSAASLAAGEEPHRRYWLAEDDAGAVVALASSGPGKAWWDTDPERPAPPVGFNMDTLYTLERTHGSGLGQRLLDTCLPDHHEAYLWVLNDNPRAEAFYARNGFVKEFQHRCGDTWFHRPMYRAYRTREMALASPQAARERERSGAS